LAHSSGNGKNGLNHQDTYVVTRLRGIPRNPTATSGRAGGTIHDHVSTRHLGTFPAAMTLLGPLLLVASTSIAQQDTTVRDTIVALDEMVVSGRRGAAAQRLDEPTAHALTTLTLSDRAAGTVAVHLLREVTGVHVQQTSAGQGAVVLRGMVGNQVLMRVDGVPMNNGTYRDGPGQYFATVDPESVRRIEVVRGPASVLYGSDAQGGVVNVLTQPHPHLGYESARIAGSASSAEGAYRARLSAGGQREHWSLSAGGTVASAGDLRPGGDLATQTPTGYRAEGLDLRARLWVGRHSVTTSAQHYAMHDVPRYDRYVTFRAPAPGRDAQHTFEPQTRQLAYLRHTWDHGTPLLRTLETTVSLAVQREGRHRVRLDDGIPDSIETSWRDDVFTPGVSVVGTSVPTLAQRPIEFTWGGEWYHDRLTSDGYDEHRRDGTRTPLTRTASDDSRLDVGNFPDGATADRIGVFTAVVVPITGFLSGTLGGRWSLFRNEADVGTEFGGLVENSSSELTGQVGLVATPAHRWRIVGRLAQGFRAPNLYDLTRTGPVPGGVALPNPDARPEESLSGEVGVRYAGRTGAFDVTAYYTRVTDFLDRVPGEFHGDTIFEGERIFKGVNVGTAGIRGFELEAAKTVGPLRLDAGAVYTYGVQTPASGVEEPMSKIPPFSGYAVLRWLTQRRGLFVEYVLRWALTQDRLGTRDLDDPRIPPGGTPGYAVHGIRAGADLPSGLEISAGLDNLLNALYRSHASGVDAAGRHVWIGASWTVGKN
jgi:outer membrane receptor protein involved in Fe transport